MICRYLTRVNVDEVVASLRAYAVLTFSDTHATYISEVNMAEANLSEWQLTDRKLSLCYQGQ